MSTVKSRYNMACPNCGKDNQIEVRATVWIDLVPDGHEPHDHPPEWDSDSPCVCGHCYYEARAGDFHLEGPFTLDESKGLVERK